MKLKVTAAVVNGVNEPYVLEELSLGELRYDEVLVKIVATGMCHSDEALRVGDAQYPLPAVLGHEGAGIIVEVGSAVKRSSSRRSSCVIIQLLRYVSKLSYRSPIIMYKLGTAKHGWFTIRWKCQD